MVLDEVGSEQDMLGKTTDHKEVMMERSALYGDWKTVEALHAEGLTVDRGESHVWGGNRAWTRGHGDGAEGFLRQKANLGPCVVEARKFMPIKAAGDLGAGAWSKEGGEAGDGKDRGKEGGLPLYSFFAK